MLAVFQRGYGRKQSIYSFYDPLTSSDRIVDPPEGIAYDVVASLHWFLHLQLHLHRRMKIKMGQSDEADKTKRRWPQPHHRLGVHFHHHSLEQAIVLEG
eukprot:8434556-Ditylum_brightwellii.AAC.1